MEIEVKVPVKDLQQVFAQMERVGARSLGKRRQVDVYFAHPLRDFGVTDEALRLRLDGDLEKITYKGPKLDKRSKTREEIEVEVPFEKMRTILLRLGFLEFIRIEKERSDYEVGNITLSLDRVTDLGEFVELEFHGDDKEEGLATIEELKRKLGLDGNEIRSYLELMLEKKRS